MEDLTFKEMQKKLRFYNSVKAKIVFFSLIVCGLIVLAVFDVLLLSVGVLSFFLGMVFIGKNRDFFKRILERFQRPEEETTKELKQRIKNLEKENSDLKKEIDGES